MIQGEVTNAAIKPGSPGPEAQTLDRALSDGRPGEGMPEVVQRVLASGMDQQAQANLPGTERIHSSERELVAAERDVDPRLPDDPKLGNDLRDAYHLRDAYDLRLYREPNDDYTLELHMDVEFAFISDSASAEPSEREKMAFINEFIRDVERVWDGHSIPNEDGEQIRLDIRLDGRIRDQPLSELQENLRERNPFRGSNFIVEVHADKDMSDHTAENWLNYVTKVEGMVSLTGDATEPLTRRGELDGRTVITRQNVAAHEFGHMIGLEDEYASEMNPRFGHDHPSADEHHSIMNNGNFVEDRHLRILEDWVDDNLDDDEVPTPELRTL